MKTTGVTPRINSNLNSVKKDAPLEYRESVRTNGLHRRNFLAVSGLGLAAFAMSPFAFAEDKVKETLEQKLDKQLEVIAALDLKDANFSNEISKFIELKAGSQSEYIKWYAASVASYTLKKDVKRQTVLESIARKDVGGSTFVIPINYSGNTETNKEENNGIKTFFNAYAQIIEANNGSEEFIVNGLSTLISLADNDQASWGGLDTDTIGESINVVYKAAIQGVKKLPSVNEKVKSLMFTVLISSIQHIGQYGGGNKDLLANMLETLSNNYFGAKQYQNDYEGFSLFSKQLAPGNGSYSSIPMSHIYALMDKNPDYFKSAVESWVKRIEATPSDSNTSLAYAGIDIFKMFNSNALSRLESNDYTADNGYKITKKTKSELKKEYKTWSDEQIAKPIGKVLLSLFDENKNAKLTVEEVRTPKGKERYITDSPWRFLNSALANISNDVPDEFCISVSDKMLARINNDFSPFNRQKAYETLGISLAGIRSVQTRSDYSKSFEEMMIYEPYALGVKGLASVAARNLEKVSPAGNTSWTFMDNLESQSKKGKVELFDYLEQMDTAKLTDIEKAIVGALRLVCGDRKHIRAVMPDRRFPGPTFKREYKLREDTSDGKKAGERIKIEVTPGINYRADDEYRQKGELIKEEVSYTDENRRDGRAFHRALHNAFLFLAYTASQYPQGDSIMQSSQGIRDNAMKFKNFIVKFLDDRLRLHLIYFDEPSRAEYWGEKISALAELYLSTPLIEKVQNGPNQVIDNVTGYLFDNRQEALAGVFFGDGFESNNKKSKEIYGEGDPLFKAMSDLKIEPRYIEIIKAGMAEGVFNTALNRGMQKGREFLRHIGGKYAFSNVLDEPYKFIDLIYKTDLTGEKQKQLEEEKAEWQERAKAKIG